MESSTMFMVQLLAPILLVMGVSLLINKKFYMEAYREVMKDSAFLMMTMVVNLLVGVAILLKHNLWSSLPEVIVSLFGVGALLKGLHVALSPKGFLRMVKFFMRESYLLFGGVLLILLGGYFTYLGYFV